MKRSEIRPALAAILAAALPAIPVYLDDGSKRVSQEMEDALQAGGACLAVGPILQSKAAEKSSRTALHEVCAVSVHLRMNPDKFDAATHDETVSAVQEAVMADAAKRAAKLWGFPEVTAQLVPEDIGCLTSAIYFEATVITI